MSRWLDPAPWWLVLAGWSVIVALWHTSVVALGLATWRSWRSNAPSGTQYRAAAGVLMLSVVLTLATPGVLLIRARAAPVPVIASMVGAPLPSAPPGPARISRPVQWRASAQGLASLAAPWIGAAWCIGFAIGLLRFVGGWGLAQWIRRRASDVRSARVTDAAATVSGLWGLPPAPLLSSEHVEAPVVIGARSPAVLLPIDLEQRLDSDALPPLLAHEFAHVDRRDYAANLLQSLADALLFFSPGARWISGRIREAREYCCDDIVAARCGTGAYVSALTMLAGLGVATRARPAVSAAGPRLIVRIHRLLKGDVMTPFTRYRLTALAGLVLLTAVAATGAMPLSAAAIAGIGVAPAPARASTRGAAGDIPMGFLASQPGAALRLRAMRPTDAGLCGAAEIENLANVAITGIRFVAFLHTPGAAPFGERSNLAIGSVATSDLLPVDLPPSQIATLDVGLVSADEARERLRTRFGQMMCGVAEIRYANGGRWEMPPATIFGPDRAEIPRALIGQALNPGESFCRDEGGGEYSEGAVVPIRLEPFRFTRCVAGSWIDYELSAPGAGKPFVWLNLVLANGRRPELGVEPGEMARLEYDGGRWGIRPTIDPADERRVRLELFDVKAEPAVRIADVWTSAGDAPVSIPEVSFTVRVRATRNP